MRLKKFKWIGLALIAGLVSLGLSGRTYLASLYRHLGAEVMIVQVGTCWGATLPDVAPGSFYYQAVNCLAKAPYCTIAGFEDGYFKADLIISRAEAVVFVTRYHVNVIKDWQLLAPASASFPDVPKSYWAYKEIETAKANGWVAGFADGTFKPEDPWISGICTNATGKPKVCDPAPMTTMTRGKYAQRLYDIGMTRNSFPLCLSASPSPSPSPSPSRSPSPSPSPSSGVSPSPSPSPSPYFPPTQPDTGTPTWLTLSLALSITFITIIKIILKV